VKIFTRHFVPRIMQSLNAEFLNEFRTRLKSRRVPVIFSIASIPFNLGLFLLPLPEN